MSLNSSPNSTRSHKSNRLWLIGMMACGKSSVARALAGEKMNIVDLDTRIVERAGMSISEIFDIQKEKGFRQIEHEHVVELSKMETENMIIATGGGAPCFHDNMGRL